jgi:NADPH-dependent 2,4-dienoyl-CoA reductase/sulfur reductase-like enzyme
VGVRPENKLAVDARLEVGPRGGIRVNEHLQTSDPDIYAVGDAIEVKDVVSGDPTQVPLAGPANRQGRIAADNIFGRSVRYRGTQGTAIVGVFDRTAAMTGPKRRFEPIGLSQGLHSQRHAGTAGAEAMTLAPVRPDRAVLRPRRRWTGVTSGSTCWPWRFRRA